MKFEFPQGGLESPGGSRVIIKTFRVVAEAYKIIAVSLNSAGSEQGGSEIDFGKLPFKLLHCYLCGSYNAMIDNRPHPCWRLCRADDENGQQRKVQNWLQFQD